MSQAGYATQLIHDTPHPVNGGHNFAWTFIRGAKVNRPWVTGNLHQKIAEELHSAALDEIERRGLDPKLVSWLRSGGDTQIPEDCRLWDGYPGPPGFYTYWDRIYIDD